MTTGISPLFDRLSGARRVLLAGAGGGYDIFASIPLAMELLARGKEVAFANLTFTYLGGTDATYLAPHVAMVTPDTTGEEHYFPERALARWLAPAEVYAFEKVGVAPLRDAYRALVAHTHVDAIVLVDGGTDILMRGDEAGLGTPQEDMASLAAVAGLDLKDAFVVCLGFGVDTFHGVCHAHFLENVAALERAGAYLGAASVGRHSDGGRAYLEAVAFAEREHPARISIVNGSIAAAVKGEFGNVPISERTRNSELFINPLMSLYFAFDLAGVAEQNLYLRRLEGTRTIFDVSLQIEAFRHEVESRPRCAIPH